MSVDKQVDNAINKRFEVYVIKENLGEEVKKLKRDITNLK